MKSKVCVYGFSLAENAGSKTPGVCMCVFCVCVVCCQLEVSVAGRIDRPEQSYLLWCFQMSVIEESYGGDLGPQGLSSHVKQQYDLTL